MSEAKPMDEELPADDESEEKPKDDEKAKIEENIQIRLERQARKHAQDKAESDARLAEAHRRIQMMQQQMQPQQPTQQGMPQNQAQQPMPQQMQPQQPAVNPQDIINHYTMQQKLISAAEKDPEFAALIGDADKGIPQTGNFIHLGIVTNEMSDLDNAAAVIKHLKKNSKDYAVADALTKKADRIKFFNELSEKLTEQQSTPRPPEFEPEPELGNNGSSGQDFDLKEYMRQKGR